MLFVLNRHNYCTCKVERGGCIIQIDQPQDTEILNLQLCMLPNCYNLSTYFTTVFVFASRTFTSHVGTFFYNLQCEFIWQKNNTFRDDFSKGLGGDFGQFQVILCTPKMALSVPEQKKNTLSEIVPNIFLIESFVLHAETINTVCHTCQYDWHCSLLALNTRQSRKLHI